MSDCWYCHWGWPAQVANIFWRYEPDAGTIGMMEGPATVVWGDENFTDHAIDYCLQQCRDKVVKEHWTPETIQLIRRSLEDLRKFPEHIRCCEPVAYEGKRPQDFPPPNGIEMLKVGE